MKAVYPGSFDPWTEGHSHVLKQALPFFDTITLAVAYNPEKPPAMFDVNTRLNFMADVIEGFKGCGTTLLLDAFEITGPNGLYTVDYAEQLGAQYIIRGIRNAADYEYEKAMKEANKRINPKIQTVFYMSDPEFAIMSSSLVRSHIGPKGWEEKVKVYLPKEMWESFFSAVSNDLLAY